MTNNTWGIALSILAFILYWCLLPTLINVILESPKLKLRQWFLVGIVNTVIVLGIFIIGQNALLAFYCMMACMFTEFMLFYKDRSSGALLCTLACCIHVISIFLITLGVFALFTGHAPYEMLRNQTYALPVCAIAFFLLDLAILTVLKFVPLSKVRMINQHKEQQRFIIMWMAVNTAFLLYLSHLFNGPNRPLQLAASQLAAALATLAGLYIVLFFSFKISSILGYKEKNAELEQAINQEQQYRNSMVRDAITSYEVNVTQDCLLKGFEDRYEELGEIVHCYSDMLLRMARKLIHPDDIDGYVRHYARSNILWLFESGEREVCWEYRRFTPGGTCIWVRSTLNLVQDMESRDVKALIYVKDIDEEKKKQLELQRKAERDPLTGLYNRSTTGRLINEHIALVTNRSISALFMIDVDNFKDINDHLGHVYGDAVLCELADKLLRIFRSTDIVGRIGGDEYVVFLADGATLQTVQEKAMAICKEFHVTYQGIDGNKYTISSSVGISFFPHDGKDFSELYSRADIALYTAKSEGKNSYQIYNGSAFAGYTSQRTEIQPAGNILQKGFRENRIEYIFKMLYQSENPVAAIHSVLELVARHFSFERGYIFETSKDGKTSSNTFEWCAEGITPEINNLQNLPIEVLANAHAQFQAEGTFIVKSLDDLSPVEREVLAPQGIKSMFQFGIFDKNHLLGFVGFDNCISEAVPTDVEIDEMKTICNILATFFVKQYIDETSSTDLLARQEVMNHLKNYIYVINAKTFEILFMNEKIRKLTNRENVNNTCYNFFRGNSSQCEDCPLYQLNFDDPDQLVTEVYNEKLKIWMEVSASLMQWTDGSPACLISCSDITKQKEQYLTHLHQLESLVYVDTLTGCSTYYKFKQDALRILARQANETHFFVKLDINKFKLINQIYGYEKGNEILCGVVQALGKTMRNENEIFARVANDEFIALFTIQDTADIDTLYNDFLQNFHVLAGDKIPFKCNFPHGRYVIYPSDTQNIDMNDMFEKVNMAHKEAKLDKTLEFTFYEESMTLKAMHVTEIENSMENALSNEEFAIYLQPKYYLSDETIGGAEALARWQGSNTDLFFPNSFIPIFEQNGFIVKLDLYVFKKVCHLIKDWMDDGIEPVVVSVNFSRLHLDNPDFVKELCEIVDGIGVPRKYLEIEITETVIYDNIEVLEVLLNDIHENGFTMSMDDFGSGYSSLGMLKNLPVDVIKMDRSFFANQQNTQRAKTVIGSVIQMAALLGIRIVAEGVENQEHIDLLRELHCDMVQGYYFAKPMPTDRFTTLISNKQEHCEV